MSLEITIVDKATKEIDKLFRLNSAQGYRIAGIGVMETVKSYLAKRDELPQSRGWRKQHFNSKAARKTFLKSNSSGATVHISLVGFKTYALGEPKVIRPVNVKFLTIPARSDAYGRRAREFSGLQVLRVVNERGVPQLALVHVAEDVTAPSKTGKRVKRYKSEIGDVYYWLARSVKTKPHPEAIPSNAAMLASAVNSLREYVNKP